MGGGGFCVGRAYMEQKEGDVAQFMAKKWKRGPCKLLGSEGGESLRCLDAKLTLEMGQNERKRDTRSYYPKRCWEILPKEILGDTTQRDIEEILGDTTQRDIKEILGDTTQRDIGRYYPKRYWEILSKEILGDITQSDTKEILGDTTQIDISMYL
ncbi:hypothetical protein Tco_0150760, partial [Tanacetum coccineum]